MQQQRKFIIFILVAFMFLLSVERLKMRLWPPKPRARPDSAQVDPAAEVWPWKARDLDIQGATLLGLVANLAPATPGFDDLPRLGVAAALSDQPETAHLVRLAQPKKAIATKPTPSKEPAREVVLGSVDSFLRVVLTTQGAAIRRMTLNKFQKADANGRPVFDGDGKPTPMDLIPDDPNNPTPPSMVLFHYLDPALGKDEHPLDEGLERVWKLDETPNTEPNSGSWKAVFSTEIPEQHVRLIKTYTLEPGDYHVGLEVRVQSTSKEPVLFRYQLAGPHGLPIEGEWYTSIFRNGILGWVDKTGSAWRQLEDSVRISAKLGGDAVQADEDRFLRYAAVAVQYFASAIVVDDEQPNQNFLHRLRATVETSTPPIGRGRPRTQFDDVTVRLVTDSLKIPVGGEVVHKYMLYNGPVKVRLLGFLEGDRHVRADLVSRYEDKLHLNTLTDYHSQSPATFLRFISETASRLGWTTLLIWSTNMMHGLLWAVHRIVPNYGLCIIFLTLFVRMVLYPVTRRQSLMMIKSQAMAPELAKLKIKFADDQAGMLTATREVYAKHGFNPLMGCLPLLLQMPIALGLYYALMESIMFRLAPFLWMKNLAAPDMLFEWGDGIPYISRPENMGELLYLGPFFNLLPFFAVTLMMIQQKMMTPPALDEQQEMQQKMTKYMMIFFAFMFYKVAAGLCIYIITTSAWALAERKLLLPKVVPPGTAPVILPPPKPKPRGPQSPKTEEPSTWSQQVKNAWTDILREARKK